MSTFSSAEEARLIKALGLNAKHIDAGSFDVHTTSRNEVSLSWTTTSAPMHHLDFESIIREENNQ